MKRVMIIGNCGAGKSTLAKKIHDLTQLRLIHLDQEYWLPGWIEPDLGIWSQKLTDLVNQDEWIIDGNYGSTMEMRMKRADTIVLMEVSTWKSMIRVIKRVIKHYGRTRDDMAAGCDERLDLSFLHYVLVYNFTRKPANERKIKTFGQGKTIVRLKSNRDIEHYLSGLKAKAFAIKSRPKF